MAKARLSDVGDAQHPEHCWHFVFVHLFFLVFILHFSTPFFILHFSFWQLAGQSGSSASVVVVVVVVGAGVGQGVGNGVGDGVG